MLEEPINGEIHGGVGNLRGWAVASEGIEKVEIFIDGEYAFDAPYGGARGDVGGAFPEVDDAGQSGFSLAYAYSSLTSGTHTITALAHTTVGTTKENAATFEVVKFKQAFINDPDAVDLTGTSCSVSTDDISVGNAQVEGDAYDVTLNWRTAEQGFEIVKIDKIHGLSTAWKLSETYKNPGDIIVIEKKDTAAGASGIACGVVRNNYFQPAMRELMAHSVSVWESDPKAFKYNPVGYLQISPEVMHEDVASIYEQQKAIGYESDFIEGEKDCMKYMKGMFDDWQAQGITSILHEKKGGYAFNKDSIKALENKSTSNGVQVMKGVKVTGFKRGSNSKAVTGVETDKGTIDCEQVVIGAGPWARDFWNMLELPKTANIKGKDGKMHVTDMWTYWMLQEGVIGVEPDFLKTNDGKQPPVVHVDSTAPLYSDKTKKLITDKIWGIYYKPDIDGLGVQGGTSPYIVKKHFDQVNVDPYGIESPEYQTTDAFSDMWCSALAHCQKRFEGKSDLYRKGPSGGLGCMTPDSFPIFDRFFENVYMIADANHGYKMIGVGELVAKEILGTESDLLKPFRFNRYEKGELHPTSNSPFPWS